jgi:hypothetical protein
VADGLDRRDLPERLDAATRLVVGDETELQARRACVDDENIQARTVLS